MSFFSVFLSEVIIILFKQFKGNLWEKWLIHHYKLHVITFYYLINKK